MSYENVSKGKENIPINSQKNINSNEKDVKLSYSNKESSISKSNESLKIEKQIHLSPPKSKVSSSIKNISSSKSNMSNSKEKSNSKNIPLENLVDFIKFQDGFKIDRSPEVVVHEKYGVLMFGGLSAKSFNKFWIVTTVNNATVKPKQSGSNNA